MQRVDGNGPVRWAPAKTTWFLVTGVTGLLAMPLALSVETAAVGAALGFGTFLFGHTVGLHRGVLHRSYQMPLGLRNFLLWVFVLTGLGGPLWWMRAHNQRDHWQNQDASPPWFRYDHGPVQDFWWNVHTVYVEDRSYVREEDRLDPWLGFLQRTWLLQNLAFFAVLGAVGGWEHLAIGGFLRVWLSLILHWYVGYEAHSKGELRYPVAGATECGRNRPILGILSLGEGFHNNHHAFPDSARIGFRSREIDIGWWVIVGMEAIGLAWDVNRPEACRQRTSASVPAP